MTDYMKANYTYWLPDANGDKRDYTATSNSVVLIGSNGSGKSRLAAWIELQDFKSVHRVGPQRNLNFSEHVPMKSYEQAENAVFFGQEDPRGDNKNPRWGWGKYTTQMLDDFDNVLSAVIAQVHNENQQYRDECKLAEERGEEKPNTKPSVLERLISIWESVLPHRELYMNDGAFFAKRLNDSTHSYSATQMSDGERSVLYLVAQVLCVPEGKTIIVDEPELHLHPSLMDKLWELLEKSRQDCFFIYVTHDVGFAALHPNAQKIWVKSFDGTNWDWCFIEESDLPESLLIDLMGNRRPVLFVEGDYSSLDYQLYTALYPEHYVVPRGGCEQVIQCTKAFAHAEQLHNYHAYGIVDSDYRHSGNIDSLRKHNVYCLDVAEVENLFLVEDVVRFVASYLGHDEESVFQRVKHYVIFDRLSQQKEAQALRSTISRVKNLFATLDISTLSVSEARESLAQYQSEYNFDQLYLEALEEYNTAIDEDNYRTALKLFNEKGIAKTIGHFFGHDDKDYCPLIIRLLKSEHADKLLDILRPYVPQIPT